MRMPLLQMGSEHCCEESILIPVILPSNSKTPGQTLTKSLYYRMLRQTGSLFSPKPKSGEGPAVHCRRRPPPRRPKLKNPSLFGRFKNQGMAGGRGQVTDAGGGWWPWQRQVGDGTSTARVFPFSSFF
ncbi:uncharacterized protein [Gossypium hirsutum]|uniref:Uncharacterized protein isoform X2 n=1 Tax=Gossypium hirsutum TaxID=3635 RepID=A0ABM2YRK2_GOSHI|nr:uncharacterized protein LOC121206145 isoform X2 [Gossypium hirsutum]